jgi:hypothetical protein
MLDLARSSGWANPRLWRLNLGTVALMRGVVV